MDTTDWEIQFDKHGVCNHCKKYELLHEKFSNHPVELVLDQIKQLGRGKKYDCLIGISGGVDSSYLLHYLYKNALRPYPVHIDMGWNSKNAVENIKLLLQQLELQLHTHVIDWNEFKSVQLAYLRSGIIDADVPTDHAYISALYKIAAKKGIKAIITGHNYRTESLMPKVWVADKKDAINLRDIYQKNGNGVPLRSFPLFSLTRKFKYYNILGIREIHVLNYLPYNRQAAIEELIKIYNWQPHPVKHGESVWTRFFQCYILPNKFGIDKRKAHLSNMICSGQMSREEALIQLNEPIYIPALKEDDKQFVLKKLGLSEQEFTRIMQGSPVSYKTFKTEEKIKHWYNQFAFSLKGLSKILKHSDRY